MSVRATAAKVVPIESANRALRYLDCLSRFSLELTVAQIKEMLDGTDEEEYDDEDALFVGLRTAVEAAHNGEVRFFGCYAADVATIASFEVEDDDDKATRVRRRDAFLALRDRLSAVTRWLFECVDLLLMAMLSSSAHSG